MISGFSAAAKSHSSTLCPPDGGVSALCRLPPSAPSRERGLKGEAGGWLSVFDVSLSFCKLKGI